MRCITLAVMAALVVSGTAHPLAGPGPSGLAAEFAAVRDRIAPRPEEELWRQIPWKTSLLEARQVAARDGKPIFLWSMDGHPLWHG